MAEGSKLFGSLCVTLRGEDELQKRSQKLTPDTAEAPTASPSLTQPASYLLHTTPKPPLNTLHSSATSHTTLQNHGTEIDVNHTTRIRRTATISKKLYAPRREREERHIKHSRQRTSTGTPGNTTGLYYNALLLPRSDVNQPHHFLGRLHKSSSSSLERASNRSRPRNPSIQRDAE